MRRVRYCVVMSLDGYIAGPKGEADWITTDPDFDFAAMFSPVRHSPGGAADVRHHGGRSTCINARYEDDCFSRTLRQEDHPEVTIVAGDQRETLAALKASPGKDSWLFGVGRCSVV